jgi:hypothetical protein
MLPDLTVTEIFFDQECHLKYKIRNIGGAMAETSIPVVLEKRNGTRMSTVVMAGNVQTAGGQETFTWITTLNMSDAPFTIILNPSPIIIESNYGNNSLKTSKGATCGTSKTPVPGSLRR